MRRSIQNKVEALYQQHIIEKAIVDAHESIAKGRFDPQGHWLTEVTLDEDDYREILNLAINPSSSTVATISAAGGNSNSSLKVSSSSSIVELKDTTAKDELETAKDELETAKDELEILLACKITNMTYCNLDIREFPNLKDEFIRWVQSNPRPGTTEDQVAKISAAAQWLLSSDNGGSVIALQEEMEMHLRLITHALQKAIDEACNGEISAKVASFTQLALTGGSPSKAEMHAFSLVAYSVGLRIKEGEEEKSDEDDLEESPKAFFKVNPNQWQDINTVLAKQMNELVRDAYQQALLESFVDVDVDVDVDVNGAISVDIKKLNHALDQSRETVSEGVHGKILAEIVKYLSRHETKMTDGILQKLSKIVADSGINKHLFESTTAIDSDYLRTDQRNATVTRISGSNMTAHNKQVGDCMADRRLFRNRYLAHQDEIKPIVTAIDDQSIEIRVPSIAVLKDKDGIAIPHEAIIADVVIKLGVLHRKAFGEKNGVLIYNLLTSLPLDDGRFETNKQLKSARCILEGAHRYNKANLGCDKLVLVQNIGVNQRDADLQSETFQTRNPLGAYQHQHGTVHEACLMSELALMHTLCENKDFLDVMDKDKGKLEGFYGKSINQYKAYLTGIAGGIEKQQFKLSPHSVALISYLRDKTDDKGEPLCSSENFKLIVGDDASLKTLAAKTLYKIFLRGDYKNGQYGMLVQALSVYLEKVSIYGCKSANDRYAAVSGRVELLNSIDYRLEDATDNGLRNLEDDLIVALKYFISNDTKNITLTTVQSALDASFNQHNLQGSANAICHMDTGAGPKGQVRQPWSKDCFSTNHFEPSTVSNLHQKHTGRLQAHYKMSEGYLSFSRTHRHTKMLKAAANTMMQRYPTGSEHCDQDPFWLKIQQTVGKAASDVVSRDFTFSFGEEANNQPALGSTSGRSSEQPPATVRQKLYHLMMQQEVLDDNDMGVNSYFTAPLDVDGLQMYVRDARGLGSAENLDEDKANLRYEQNYTDQKQMSSRQWLIMGINYTLALATLFKTQGQEYAGESLFALAQKFIAGAEIQDALGLSEGLKTYTENYVRYVLAEQLKEHLPGLCLDKEEIADTKTAVKLLDNAKDWAAMEAPSFHVATISQLTEPALSVGQAVGKGCVVQLETPVIARTEEQKNELDNYKASAWYGKLKPVEQGLCEYYMPMIQKGRVLPSQLRNRLGIGLKNAYGSKTLYHDDFGIHQIFRHGHSGGLPVIIKEIRKHQKSIAELEKISEGTRSEEQKQSLIFATAEKNKMHKIMLDSAKQNVEQQLQFAKSVTGNPEVKTLSIILNTKWISESRRGDPTDSLITEYSELASKHVGNAAMFARVGVSLGRIEACEITPIRQIHNEVNTLCDTLARKGVSLSFYQRLQEINQKLAVYMAGFVSDESTHTTGPYDGITVAADIMLVIDLRNQLRRHLMGSDNEALKEIGNKIDEVYPFIRCASGDNRTQDGSLYAQIESMCQASDIDVDRLTALLALNAHVRKMTSVGGTRGTGGIRKDSAKAMPLPTLGIRRNLTALGEIAKNALITLASEQKSMAPKKGVIKQRQELSIEELECLESIDGKQVVRRSVSRPSLVSTVFGRLSCVDMTNVIEPAELNNGGYDDRDDHKVGPEHNPEESWFPVVNPNPEPAKSLFASLSNWLVSSPVEGGNQHGEEETDRLLSSDFSNSNGR